MIFYGTERKERGCGLRADSLKDDWSLSLGSKLVFFKRYMGQTNEQQNHFNERPISELHGKVHPNLFKITFYPPRNNGISFLPFSSVRVVKVILHIFLANLGVRKFSGRVSYSLFPHFPFGTRCCKCLISRQGCKRVLRYRFSPFDALAPLLLSRWS